MIDNFLLLELNKTFQIRCTLNITNLYIWFSNPYCVLDKIRVENAETQQRKENYNKLQKYKINLKKSNKHI